MKVSIWQQWASNHSSYFWIAGTFDTIAQAETAYSELRDMLLAIDNWHRTNPQESWDLTSGRKKRASPPEVAFGQQYSFDWPEALDWMNVAYYLSEERVEEHIDGALARLGSVVIVSQPCETWCGVKPFDTLLARFGAQTAGYDFGQEEEGIHHHVRLTLTCTAPGEQQATAIEEAMQGYLVGDLSSPDNPPPWDEDPANFTHNLRRDSILAPKTVQRLVELWQLRLDWYPNDPTYQSRQRLEQLALKSYDDEHVRFERNENALRLTMLWYNAVEQSWHEMPLLVALVMYFEANNCNNIQLQFDEVAFDRGE